MLFDQTITTGGKAECKFITGFFSCFYSHLKYSSEENIHPIPCYHFFAEIFITIMALRCFLSFIIASVLIVPANSDSLADVPDGHLKPLGSHRPPETNLVDDLQEMPSPQEFWTKYVLPSKAVVLRGAAKHGRAFTLWTDKYLKEKFADLEVRLEAKKEKSSKVPIGAKGVGRDTIGKLHGDFLIIFLVNLSCNIDTYKSST